ncbi:WD40 repeat-like protein [Malassezia sp. CBS 17886]|nr:WD40 repeat-like protein [Malassezia sp. CBS 17886]
MSLTPVVTLAANPTTVRAKSTKLDASVNGASADAAGGRIAYAHGRTVVVRELDRPEATFVYAEHAHPVTVARFSPSGYYMASGDASGVVRVWDLAGGEQLLKVEVAAVAGRINDLVWDGESKRILAVGEGRERFGHAFLVDAGSSAGEISGHSKPINAVAVKPQRPFRAATGGDDGSVLFYTGVPFKYARTLSTHTRFVQDVAYAPSGATFVSAGSDGRLFVYDGTTGDVQGECSADGAHAPAHQGTIFAVAYAPDSVHVVSCGADARVHVWDVAQRRRVATWQAPSDVDRAGAQQTGVAWMRADTVASVSLRGDLNVLRVAEATLSRVRVLVGATKAITALVRTGAALVASSYDGRAYRYADDGHASEEALPAAQPAPSLLCAGAAAGAVVVAALDGMVRELGDVAAAASSATGMPRSIAVATDRTFVATERGIDVFMQLGTAAVHHSAAKLGAADAEPTSVAAAPDGTAVAVGFQDARVRLYTCDRSGALTPTGALEHGRTAATALAFSPDASLLAAGEASGKILVYALADHSLKLAHWVAHTARINSVQWSPDGQEAVSASLDTHVYVWSLKRPMKNVSFKNAHAGGATSALWLGENGIASAGADGAVRKFALQRA